MVLHPDGSLEKSEKIHSYRNRKDKCSDQCLVDLDVHEELLDGAPCICEVTVDISEVIECHDQSDETNDCDPGIENDLGSVTRRLPLNTVFDLFFILFPEHDTLDNCDDPSREIGKRDPGKSVDQVTRHEDAGAVPEQMSCSAEHRIDYGCVKEQRGIDRILLSESEVDIK